MANTCELKGHDRTPLPTSFEITSCLPGSVFSGGVHSKVLHAITRSLRDNTNHAVYVINGQDCLDLTRVAVDSIQNEGIGGLTLPQIRIS